jgi:pimeloyl-ACP methyl ester carboxylesterase
MRTRTIELDGPLHMAEFGGHGPVMVLVHGLGGSHVDWLSVGDALAERCRVVALDLPGFGRTPLLDRSASVPAHAETLDRFIAAEVGGPAILVGNSMGGLVSMLEAADHPASVRGLVLTDPASPPDRSRPADPVTEQTFTMYDTPGMGEALLESLAEMFSVDEAFDQLMFLICGDPTSITPEMRAAQIALANDRREMAWAHRAFLESARSLLQIIWHDPEQFHSALARVEAPALVVQGVEDRLVQVWATRDIARRRPDWDAEELAGIGHVPMMEDPEGFVRVVFAWLDRKGLLDPAAVAGAAPATE